MAKLGSVAFRMVHCTLQLSAYVVLMILRNITVTGCLCYSVCLFSLYLASFTMHTKIMRHFRVRKLHQKIYLSCNCYGWENMLVITQHFVQPCKETEISLRLTDIHLLHCYFWYIIRHVSYFHFFLS